MTPCHFFQNTQHPADLGDRLRDAGDVTAEFLSDIITRPAGAFRPRPERQDRPHRAADPVEAWTDAALALIDLELPQWQVRRLAYDEGEWHCALSRQRELPDWLDQSIETRHADLALAILSAFVEAQRISATVSRTSVPDRAAATPTRSTSRSAATISPESRELRCHSGSASYKRDATARFCREDCDRPRSWSAFGVRLLVLVAFAAFGSIGFGRSLALLWMAAVLCAVIAGIRREPPLDTDLNHWDEMVAYAAYAHAGQRLNRTVRFETVRDPYAIPMRSRPVPLEFISVRDKDIGARDYLFLEGIPT